MLLAFVGTDRMDRQTDTHIHIHTLHPHTKQKIKMAPDGWEVQQV